jgi:nucleoside-diphosphate-sugar epimerase
MSNNVIVRDAAAICERVNLATLWDKTILVTGASGLMGTYFLATLAHMKESGTPLKVIAQVRSEPAPHTAEIIRHGGFKLAQVNLADYQECSSLPEADMVIHSAGYAQPAIFMANPAATFQVNTTATAILLEKLRPGGAFLFLSSSEIYSGLKKSIVNEYDIGMTTPLHPRASYIEGKRGGETICNAYRSKGIRAVSARLALAYGPGTRKSDKRALNSFIEKALCQKRIELMDAGKAIRTYCHVSDAVELMWQAALHGTQPVYNIGGHSTVTIAELAKLVGKLVGVPVSFPATQTEVAGAPEEVRLDLTRLETEFHKKNYVSLEDGLRATIEWQSGLYAS